MSKVIINTNWSPELAYAVGLITSDGNLSKDGRHIDFTSKDFEQIEHFKKILKLDTKIILKNSGSSSKKIYYCVQFSNVIFYKFLLEIGLTPNKSKTIEKVDVPDEYFIDFLRGMFDGDGYTYSYWDKRWKSSFMLYVGFVSASLKYIKWLSHKIKSLYDENGKIRVGGKTAYILYFPKYSSIRLLKKIYYDKGLICLKRKWFKISQSLGIIEKQARVSKLVDEPS